MSTERPESQTHQDLEQLAVVLGARGGKRILHDTDGTVRDQFGINFETEDSDIIHELVIDLQRKTLVVTDLRKPQEKLSKVYPKLATSTYNDYEGFETVQGQKTVRLFGAGWSLTVERYWDTPGKLRFNSDGKSPSVEVVPENIKKLFKTRLSTVA